MSPTTRSIWRPLATSIALVLTACGDDNATITSVRDTAATSTVASTTAAPTTTGTAPPTAPADTTAAYVPPDGAVALGHEVYITVPDGWTVNDEEGVTTLTNDAVTVNVQVLSRDAVDPPAVVLQEYVDSFDTDFDAVSYSQVVLHWTSTTTPPVQQYRLFYETYDESEGDGINGALYLYLRGDGLSVLYDIWASESGMGLPQSSFETIVASLAAAPLTEPLQNLPEDTSFRLESAHEWARVHDDVGFGVPPGFSVVEEGDDVAHISNGMRDFEVHHFRNVDDVDQVLAMAKEVLAGSYSDIVEGDVFGQSTTDAGLLHAGNNWNATYTADGKRCGGIIDVLVDPDTHDAYAYIDGWYWPDDNTVPNEPAAYYVWTSLIDSLSVARWSGNGVLVPTR